MSEFEYKRFQKEMDLEKELTLKKHQKRKEKDFEFLENYNQDLQIYFNLLQLRHSLIYNEENQNFISVITENLHQYLTLIYKNESK